MRQVADEIAVGGEEVVLRQLFEPDPAQVIEDAVFQLACELIDGEELQIDGAAVAIVVADLRDAAADGGGDAELFIELAGEGDLGAFAGLDFAAGTLPLERHGLIGAALADEDFIAAQHEGRNDETQRGRARELLGSFAPRYVAVRGCLGVVPGIRPL